MVAIVFISLANRDQRRSKRALTAFRHEYALCFCKIGGKPAQKRKLEAARTRTRFSESIVARPDFIWHSSEWRAAAGHILWPVVSLRAEPHADKTVSPVFGQQPGDRAGIKPFTKGNNGKLFCGRKVEKPLLRPSD